MVVTNNTHKRYKILIAEDNLLNQKLLTVLLGKNNLDYVTAKKGSEVIDKFKSENPDLILMDIGMPDLNGIDAAIEIRNLEKNKKTKIPIIAVTGHSSKRDLDMIDKSGMNDFIVKPFDFQKLMDKIKHHLDKV